MKVRILFIKGNDGSGDYVAPVSIADDMTLDVNDSWQADRIDEAKQMYGSDYVTHGFVDVEIPDAVIASVLNQYADAGLVKASAVSPLREIVAAEIAVEDLPASDPRHETRVLYRSRKRLIEAGHEFHFAAAQRVYADLTQDRASEATS